MNWAIFSRIWRTARADSEPFVRERRPRMPRLTGWRASPTSVRRDSFLLPLTPQGDSARLLKAPAGWPRPSGDERGPVVGCHQASLARSARNRAADRRMTLSGSPPEYPSSNERYP